MDRKTTELDAVTSLNDADIIYAVTDIATTAASKKITVANAKASLTAGNVVAPATNTADYLPQWDGANSKTLKNGVAIPAGGLAGLTALGDKVDKVAGSRLITSAESTILGNTSNTNSGDNATNTQYSSLTQYTDELAQDAVGGMVDGTLTYTDETPELKVTNPVTPAVTGFTITAGTTPKTLTVGDTASVSGTNTGDESDASTTVKGIVELAIASEVDTGTSEVLAITPDALAGSNLGTSKIQLKICDDATVVTTGDGKIIFMIPSEMNGMNLVSAHAMVSTVSSSGLPLIQIRNVTDSADMLSTRITIDATEYTSYDATDAPVIDATHDDVATGDRIAIDVDGAGTGAKGLTVYLAFRLP